MKYIINHLALAIVSQLLSFYFFVWLAGNSLHSDVVMLAAIVILTISQAVAAFLDVVLSENMP